MTELSTNISFTDEQVLEDSKKKELQEGWYRFINLTVEKKVAGTGSLMIATTCAPLKNPNDGSSAFFKKVYNNITLPLVNGDVAGHKAPKTMWVVSPYFAATLEEKWPQFPVWENGVCKYNGQVIDPSDEEAARQEVSRSRLNYVKQLWLSPENDPEYGINQLKGCVFYAELFTNEQGYRNLKNYSLSLPNNASLVPSDKFLG